MIGTTVGKYRVVDRLGRGGMGTVYKAVDETLDREVAIKVLNPDLNDSEVLKRFRAEAVTLARLNHPGIATLYELHRHEDDLLMVMEFVRGETFHDLSERLGPLAPPQAAHLCMQVLDALGHAHRAGIVHRDLKPANLMMSESGSVKVMDFGIARVLGTEHVTHGGYMMGTPAYMAPEQVLGREVDGRADLYAVGVVFYRLLSGQLPFDADTAIAMVQKQIADAPTPISTFRPDIPAWCTRIIDRALAKSPGDRFQSAEEFRTALLAAVQPQTLGELPTQATPTPPGIRVDPDVTFTSHDAGLSAPPTRAAASEAVAAVAGHTVAPAERTTTTVVLGWTHLIALGAMLLVLAVGVGVLAFAALRRGTLSEQLQTLGAPPAVPAATDAAAGSGDTGSAASPTEAAAPASGATIQPPGAVAATAGTLPPPPSGAARPVPGAPPTGSAAGNGAASDTAAVMTAHPAKDKPPADGPKAGGTGRVPASFEDVRILVEEDGKARERRGVLQLADKQLAIVSRDGGDSIASMQYSAIVGAFYSRSKQPRWRDAAGNEASSRIDLGPLGFFRGDRNWLILLTKGDPVIIRFEDDEMRTILSAVQERTGVTIQR
ncbi:MAG TPA: protein kinase [Vicinamibacterales bacterium]|nr:protein kinase [Vicinamibacterales bacterium]